MKTIITAVSARRIWDSRGRPTIEVEVRLFGGAVGRGVAPAGASRGRLEAFELRDGGALFGGHGVTRALAQVEEVVAPALIGLDATQQTQVDRVLIELDGTPNKAKLGGNVTTAVSVGVLQAAAAAVGEPLWRYVANGEPVQLPLPEVQIFGGGAHAARRVDIQDFLVMPVGAASFDEALCMAANVYHAAGDRMAALGRRSGVCDEGGWWPEFATNEEALDTLALAIEDAGYHNGEVAISLDIAASELGSAGRYLLGLERREFDTAAWLDLLLRWTRRYPILSVEDPVSQDDEEGMAAFTAAVGDRIQVVGDDFLVTNAQRIRAAGTARRGNATLLKLNQAGTVTETYEALQAAQDLHWGAIVSARSGETEDVTIVHLATGWNAGQMKAGAFARSERIAKWNEGLRIEGALGTAAHFAGQSALPMRRQ